MGRLEHTQQPLPVPVFDVVVDARFSVDLALDDIAVVVEDTASHTWGGYVSNVDIDNTRGSEQTEALTRGWA